MRPAQWTENGLKITLNNLEKELRISAVRKTQNSTANLPTYNKSFCVFWGASQLRVSNPLLLAPEIFI